jgi:hypothetical protein
LWPPSQDLRKIRISALNNRDVACDVTIADVRQDEAPTVTGGGAKIDDATNCSNVGTESTVDLRSKRGESGDGRFYHIAIRMDDPDCRKAGRDDEVLILVPRDDSETKLKFDAESNQLIASYSGPALNCAPQASNRLARN